MVDLVIDESKVWSPEERQKYADALPEMSLFEDHIVEGDVMVDAMKALIEEGETCQTLAVHWKSKGNEMFSDAKKYNKRYFNDALKFYDDALRYGIQSLTAPEEDLIEDIEPAILVSTILSNRAAVHLELKNYGSCRSDCARALQYWKENVKAYYRGAKASLMLRKPRDTILYCRVGLKIETANEMLQKLQKRAEALLVIIKEEERLAEQKRQKKLNETNAFKQLCQDRSIQVGPAVITDVRVTEYQGKARIDPQDGTFNWAVLFLYSEYGTSDFIQQMSENDMFLEHLANMFPENGPYCHWDERHDYVASNLHIYMAADIVPPFKTDEDWHVALSEVPESDEQMVRRERREEILAAKAQSWLRVSPFCTLGQVLKHDRYVIPGIPVATIVVKDSVHEKDFLKKINFKIISLTK